MRDRFAVKSIGVVVNRLEPDARLFAEAKQEIRIFRADELLSKSAQLFHELHADQISTQVRSSVARAQLACDLLR